MLETLLVERDDRGVVTVTLNRPEKHNVLSGQMIAELTTLAGALAQDSFVRVVVLTGAGRSFCAGGDLAWMQEQIAAGQAERAAEARKLADMLGAWNSLPKPVIARVQGQAYGGGVGMISVTDQAISVDTAMFGLTETKLGLIPATIGPYVAARLGPRTREVFMSSARFDAADAVRLGLVSRAVAANALDHAVEAAVRPYLDCAPGAVAAAKAMALELSGAVDAAQIEATIEALNAAWASEETREGLEAFFARRKPSWAVE